jgi:SAM-dependent methyltransferase
MELADFLKQEQKVVDECLMAKHGYELIWIGADLITGSDISPIKRQLKLEFLNSEAKGERPAHILVEKDALPFEQNSMDFIVLSHVLEFEKNPEILLKEVRRVLRPDGILLITGFSAWWFFRPQAKKFLRKMFLKGFVEKKDHKNHKDNTKIALYFRGLNRISREGFQLSKHYYFGVSLKLFARGYALLLEKQTIKLRPICKERAVVSPSGSVFGVEVLDPKPIPSKKAQ